MTTQAERRKKNTAESVAAIYGRRPEFGEFRRGSSHPGRSGEARE